MKFAITLESNLEGEKFNLVQNLSNELENYFKDITYGEGIKSFYIGLICVKPEFEFFFDVKKPKFIENKTEFIDGIKVEYNRDYSYKIKLDYHTFVSSSDNASFKILVEEIEKSLIFLENLPKRIKDFDRKRFKEDLKSFLNKKLIGLSIKNHNQ